MDFLEKDLSKFLSAADEINNICASEIREVDEPTFVNIVLPIIRSHLRREDNPNIRIWEQVAGGPTRYFKVVDDAGNLIAVCPPLQFNTVLCKPDAARTALATSTVVNEMIASQKVGDVQRLYNRAQSMRSLLTPVVDRDEYISAIECLIHIYKRYNLPLTEILADDAIKELDSVGILDQAGNKVADKQQDLNDEEFDL